MANERGQFGKAPIEVDRYFENIIKHGASRCYVYQCTALLTGLALPPLAGLHWTAVFVNWMLLAKLLLLLVLMVLLSIVHFRIQPAIEGILKESGSSGITPDLVGRLAPLRKARKRLAALCLFIVITVVLLGLQIFMHFGFFLNALLLVMAALFSIRVYRTPIRFGWI